MQELTFMLVALIALELQYLLWRLVRPLTKQIGAKPVFVDTSALMDGRIVTAAQTGFIGSRLVVPRSVLAELQLLADGSDADKRMRARRGLDAVSELQSITTFTNVEIMNDDQQMGSGGVDSRLIELAKKHKGMICTIDFNLAKVAKVEEIAVLNINELAQSLRMAFLPGEKISLELVQKGQEAKQAVGYLADGTMVVVEQAADSIGKIVEVEIIRSLQTTAGRMMFARKTKSESRSSDKKNTKPRGKAPRGPRTKQPTRPSSKEESLLQLVKDQEDA